MKVRFIAEKATKNTIRFTEKLESDLDAPQVGTLYIPKGTLKVIGWKEGEELQIDLEPVAE